MHVKVILNPTQERGNLTKYDYMYVLHSSVQKSTYIVLIPLLVSLSPSLNPYSPLVQLLLKLRLAP